MVNSEDFHTVFGHAVDDPVVACQYFPNVFAIDFGHDLART
jgi:hypothetical protein